MKVLSQMLKTGLRDGTRDVSKEKSSVPNAEKDLFGRKSTCGHALYGGILPPFPPLFCFREKSLEFFVPFMTLNDFKIYDKLSIAS